MHRSRDTKGIISRLINVGVYGCRHQLTNDINAWLLLVPGSVQLIH